MAPKNKEKETEKIKFFKIDPVGDIAPAFPKDEGLPHKPPDDELAAEPVFTLDETGLSKELDLKQFQKNEPFFERQLGELKPQIDDLSNIASGQQLTLDQAEVLKKYISIKEAEVRDMREQQRQYRAYHKTLSTQLEQVASRNRELVSEVDALKRKEESLRAEYHTLKQKHHEEIELLRNDNEEQLNRNGKYESQVEHLNRDREEWKQKVREDLKRIKLKERELENKYELLKRDMQALLDSKDKHVLELKKKNDALELELESMEERMRKNHTILAGIDSKKKRLIETMKLAISLLEQIDSVEIDTEEERKAG